jgi:hypothetical protein
MHPRALTAARHLTAPGARTFRTGNLRADCERWCRDHLPPRGAPVPVPAAPTVGGPPGWPPAP